MAQSPIAVVATDNLDNSITIAVSDGTRIEYFLGDRYRGIIARIEEWIKDEWYNHAVAQLTKHAWSIEVHRPTPVETSPTLEGFRQFEPAVVTWQRLRDEGLSLEEIVRVKYGSPNFTPEEVDMATKRSNGGDFKNTPDSTYRFTVIAPQAQSFHYHQQRRWYKSFENAKENAAGVLEDTNSDVELAIVELTDVFKRKPKVELMSTLKKSRR